jgi:hypothetical protein
MSDTAWAVLFGLLATFPIWIGPLGYFVMWALDEADLAADQRARELAQTRYVYVDELMR